MSYWKILLAGFCGGFSANLAMLLTFRLLGFGADAHGFLLNPAHQSEKLIAVWTQLEPLPLVVTHPPIIIGGIIIIAIIRTYFYSVIQSALPQSRSKRIAFYAGFIFLGTYLFWEFFTPFNLFGEPVDLILCELAFWLVIAFAEAVPVVLLLTK
jgi:hypothetical protein